MVSKRFVDEGDLAIPGKPLFIVEDRSRLKLAFDVPQKDAEFIRKDMVVFYKVKNKPQQVRIANVFPSIAEGKILHIEAYLDSKDGLSVGAFVPVRVLVDSKKDVVVIPKSSLFQMEGQKPFIFLVKNNKLKKFFPEIGLESKDVVEVKNLREGEEVVKSPYLSWTKLAEGETVKIRQEQKK